MDLDIERLFSGLFQCGECGVRYKVVDASEADLFCTECGEDLEPAEDLDQPVEEIYDVEEL
jgi:transcription initiation factor IIE alpha subunit